MIRFRNPIIASCFLVGALVSGSYCQDIDPGTAGGKELYEAWCSRCHGPEGKGPAEDLQLDTPVPDLAECSFNSREPRKDWKAVILHGGPARGLSMTMPAWSEALDERQADAIIDHIKTFCPQEGWPQGELNFRRAHATAKAFPENEALLIPTFTNKNRPTALTRLVYEERIGSVGQWEVSIPLASDLGSEGTSGIGDIELAGKRTLAHDADQLSILSAGLEVGLPSGNASRGFGSGAWKLSPFLAAAKGYGSFQIQASLKIEKPLKRDLEDELAYNIALTAPMTSEKQGIYPMIELNGIYVPGESENMLLITPQIYLAPGKRGHVAFSLGAQIPVGGRKPFNYRIVSFLLWEYSDGGLWW